MTQTFQHVPVLLQEAITALAIKPNGVYIDATFGRGGHSRTILSHLDQDGRLYSIDRDLQAIDVAKQIEDVRFTIIHGPFSQIMQYAKEHELVGLVDGILFDLGVSSPQLDDAKRGFSFMRDGPLDMRMDRSTGISIATWLKKASIDEITWVIRKFGEEKFARKIAKAIIAYREDLTNKPLLTTTQLASLVANVVPRNFKEKKHPATRTFQAFRIYINSELDEIAQALEDATDILAPDGRLAVISFHSLEDRLVKRFMQSKSQGAKIPHGLPLTDVQIKALASAQMKLIGKAIKPSGNEVTINSRARSSMLRIAAKL